MPDPLFAVLLGVDAALLILAIRRPWAALVVLLAGSPLNGLFSNTVRRAFYLDGPSSLALSGWHDVVLGGIAIAAVVAFLRAPRRPTRNETAVLGVLAVGVVYAIVSPYLLAAAYSFRILYEPVILLASIGILARTRGLPDWLPRRAAGAIVTGAVVAAAFTWWQVYVGGFMYLDLNYHDVGGALASAYTATFIHQPRGIGTFQGPNEFGAYLAIATVLLMVPGVLRIPLWVRTWALAVIGLALLLSFSRSGWLSTAIGVTIGLWLSRDRLPDRRRIQAALPRRRFLTQVLPPFVATMALTVLIFTSSGAPSYVGGTVTGNEPSAGGRPASSAEGVRQVASHPLGSGLGTAGPKSARFGDLGSSPPFNSETWYLNYAVQVGLPGVLVSGALICVIGLGLWRGRRHPWARAAMATGLGLGAGALFIPIVDDPSVAVPLWAVTGLAIALVDRGRAEPQEIAAATASSSAPAVA